MISGKVVTHPRLMPPDLVEEKRRANEAIARNASRTFNEALDANGRKDLGPPRLHPLMAFIAGILFGTVLSAAFALTVGALQWLL